MYADGELQEILRQYDELKNEVNARFSKMDREGEDEIDALEIEFGKALEDIRGRDLQSKKDLLAQFNGSRQKASSSNWQNELEKAWEAEAQRLREEFQERESRITGDHEGKIARLQEELRMLQLQKTAVVDDPPWLGLDLVEHPPVGVKVSKVRGPARSAGLREGDIIISIQASKNISGRQHFNTVISKTRPGERLALLLERAGVEHEVVLTRPAR
eukprot:TRINITY_DN10283_c0_g1_i1.p2 TRINITY_DN10283_c0_g1~~TRINITY_DN10283_c0_g1_i1.p2  ORF type:complete len:223 (+),score=43.21 TRINITY_DN10283_c0_g1_i1:24-671(+)